MTTTVTINSLMRFDEDIQNTCYPSPFDFVIPSKTTSSWSFKRRPFSKTGLTKAYDSFDVTVCRVFIPKSLVPELQSVLFLNITVNGNQNLDRQLGPRIKEQNIFGGYTGPCITFPEDFPNYNNTWTLVPSSPFESPLHWIYESCTHVSIGNDWKGRDIAVTIRDTQGYLLVPPMPPADGIPNIDLCNLGSSIGVTGATGCCPRPCTYVSDYKKFKKGRVVITPPSVNNQPLFQKENQVIAVLNVTYVENDSIDVRECMLPSE